MSGPASTLAGTAGAGWRTGAAGGVRLFTSAEVRELENGLTVAVLATPRAPVVASALAYRAGARDEAAGQGGIAHFLEHMMFKGSARFGPGELDRHTRALGGANNAFTSHDLTLYYFTFAADRWHRALDFELDRMTALDLDPVEVKSERQVILEELAMYQSEPWDALDEDLRRAFFPDHPYGRPVIGTREELLATGADELRAFHGRHYRPGSAVLAVVGDVEIETAHRAVAERFAGVEPGSGKRDTLPAAEGLRETRRVERHQGELCRLLLAYPAPDARHPDHPPLRLLLSILGSGRSSRLQRALVDEGQHCVWISADVQETLDPGVTTIAAECVPGAETAKVEAEVREQLDRMLDAPPSEEEVARAKRMVLADWLFGHERVEQQSFALATALALFDLDFPE
ncbi:MAG: insulinase family protein, partial [Holophagales bacterium]|nr:insulinase family protein [Holophagales bacterium]